MKKANKIISSALAALIFCSIMAGCTDKNKDSEIVPEQTKTWVEKPIFEDSSNDLVKDGKTDYVIVYPEDASSQTLTGIQELQLFFKQATGIQLESFKDTEFVENATSKIISVGETTIFKNTGINLDSYQLHYFFFQ